jgi:hypothetical protein
MRKLYLRTLQQYCCFQIVLLATMHQFDAVVASVRTLLQMIGYMMVSRIAVVIHHASSKAVCGSSSSGSSSEGVS